MIKLATSRAALHLKLQLALLSDDVSLLDLNEILLLNFLKCMLCCSFKIDLLQEPYICQIEELIVRMISLQAHLLHPNGRTIRTKTLSKPTQLTRPSTGLLSQTYLSIPTNPSGFRLLPPSQALSTRNTAANSRDGQKTPSDFGGGLITLLFGASLLSERLNGMGVVQQLELHQGLHPFIVASIVALFAAAFWPSFPSSSPTSSIDDNEVDLTSRIRKWATRGICLAMAATLLGELLTGKGALCLLDVETGIEEISDVEAIAAFIAMFLLTGPRKRSKNNSISRSRDME